MAPKKVYIKTFGCQMNVYELRTDGGCARAGGFTETDTLEDADLVILNTCHIREKAAEKVYSELGRIRLAREARRRSGGDCIIAVAGCVAQAEGEELVRRAPAVDIVVGPQSYHRLPDLLKRREVSPAQSSKPSFPPPKSLKRCPRRNLARRLLRSSRFRKAAISSAHSAWCLTPEGRNISSRRANP